MITTTMTNVLRFTEAYPSLVLRKMRPSTTLWMLTLADALQKPLENYNKVRRDMATELGAKERPATPQEARQIGSPTVMDIPPAKQVQFGEDVAKLNATTVDIFIRPLPFADIGADPIDGFELAALRPFLELPKGEQYAEAEGENDAAAKTGQQA